MVNILFNVGVVIFLLAWALVVGGQIKSLSPATFFRKFAPGYSPPAERARTNSFRLGTSHSWHK
jgi:hypothetical protein